MRLGFTARCLGIFLAFSVLTCLTYPSTTDKKSDQIDGTQTGKLLRVQDTTDWARFGRWSAYRQHTIHALVQMPQNEYCAEFSTIVVDEAKDLRSDQGQDLPVEIRGKEITLTLHSGRRLKMHLAKEGECSRPLVR